MIRLCFLISLVFMSNVQAEPVTFDLQDVHLVDFVRLVYGEMDKRPYVLDTSFLDNKDLITVSLHVEPSKVEAQLSNLLELHGFDQLQRDGVIFIRKHEDQDKDMLVYRPRFRSSTYLADVVAGVVGIPNMGTRGLNSTPDYQASIDKQGGQPGTALGMIDRTASDQMAFMCTKIDCKRLVSLLEQLDTPEAQIVLRAALYEVGTTKGEGSALQFVARLLSGKGIISAGSTLASSDQLQIATGGLDAVLSVLDQDSHFREISRPMVRVKTGSQARFSVGQQVPVLGAVTVNNTGVSQQSIQYMQSGTIFTVRPEIRQELVDLDVSQELSSFVQTTTGVNGSPTLLQRTASSQLTIKPGEVVVFAGMEQQSDNESSSRFLGFNASKQNSTSSSEVLLLIEADSI